MAAAAAAPTVALSVNSVPQSKGVVLLSFHEDCSVTLVATLLAASQQRGRNFDPVADVTVTSGLGLAMR